MIFELRHCLKGITIKGCDSEYIFKTKLFSHSSVMLDLNSNKIASITRSSWWRMNFKLKVGDRKYNLKQRLSSTELTENDSLTCFHSDSGLEFYKKSVKITQLIQEGVMSKKRTININDKEHAIALLAVTCLGFYTQRVNG